MISSSTLQRLSKVLHSAGLEPAQLNTPEDLLAQVRQSVELETSILTGLSRLFGVPRYPETPTPSSEALALVTEELARRKGAIPIALTNDEVEVVLVDPALIEEGFDEFNFDGRRVTPRLISVRQMEDLLNTPQIRSMMGVGRSVSMSKSAPSVKKFRVDREQDVIPFVDDILRTAIDLDASDIHIEPFRESARVRMRISGVLVERHEYSDFLVAKYTAVASRLKILAGCDISERRKPQDGAILFAMADGREIDLRFNTVPAKYGERLVARILAANPALSLDKLGFNPTVLDQINASISAPQGMILVTGPTGSGKTTTLYGMLQEINDPMRNILTAEDPVEYYLEGAGQIQVNEKVGLGFAEVLRAFLRQDPDVILVGEIRDTETVEIAVKASLTGHLVLSTLHTNDAVSTINRMINLGIPGHMLGAALSMIVGQRLARTNCVECLTNDPQSSSDTLKRMGLAPDVQPKVGTGCDSCDGSGYSGRVGIYECLVISEAMSALISSGASVRELTHQAESEGFESMQQMARRLVAQGQLSLAEFARTLQTQS